uniref:Uncharacterized protein n=1 Tax=Pavo cristatus TaxID=9049 RepID=A0A8C9FGS7_PAVCR
MGNMRPSSFSAVLVNLGLTELEKVSNSTTAFWGFWFLLNSYISDSKFKKNVSVLVFGFVFVFSFLLGFSSEINLETQNADDAAVLEDCAGFSSAKTASEIEGKVEKGGLPDCLDDDIIPNAASEIGAEAQIRFLKAKLRVMQEELDSIMCESRKKVSFLSCEKTLSLSPFYK